MSRGNALDYGASRLISGPKLDLLLSCRCSVKIIDLGCSIYNSEAHMSHYVQSRSYRAPEVWPPFRSKRAEPRFV